MKVSQVCFFVKQKTAYEMRISDWSSDVCSSDLQSRFVKCERPLRAGPIEGARDPVAGKSHRGVAPFGKRSALSGDVPADRGAMRAAQFLETAFLTTSRQSPIFGRTSCIGPPVLLSAGVPSAVA